MRALLSFVPLALALAASCAGPDTSYLQAQARAQDTLLSPGDSVTVLEAGSPVASGVVAADGTLNLGRMGVFEVGGTRSGDFTRLVRNRDMRLDVRVQLPAAGRTFVFGQVDVPGRYSLGQYATLSSLVRAALPNSELSDLRNVRIIRGQEPHTKELTFNVLQIERGGEDPLLMDGDIVVVPSTPLGRALGPLQGSAPAAPQPRPSQVEAVPSSQEGTR